MIKDRLEAYRRQKRNAEMKESLKKTLNNLLPWSSNRTEEEPLKEVTSDDREDTKSDDESTCSEESIEDPGNSILTKVTYTLYFLLWVTLYVIAIEYGFGTVYLMLSMLLFICLNTSSRRKKKGEPSAYSVFNPNCEAIGGTLDASQMEKELGFRTLH